MSAADTLRAQAAHKDAEMAAIEADDWPLLNQLGQKAREEWADDEVPEWRELARWAADAADALTSHHSCANLGCQFCTLLRRLSVLVGETERDSGNTEGDT